MPKQVSNQFTEFEFTQAEMYAATRFSELQLMLIQTLVARDAKQRISINIRPNDLASIQEEAALKGSINAMEYLLSLYTDITMPSAEESGKQADLPEVKLVSESQRGN